MGALVINASETDSEALFARALIVEDLDEPRQWLSELLPLALPEVHRVDTAASLLQARERMAEFAYGLALVDWGLPDGTSEELICELVAARPGAAVIVATIHDNDTHVFPALRAGATGYILKSQPSAVVVAQLQRIRLGEPALSPSIALRLLRHFRDLPGALRTRGHSGWPGLEGPERTAQALVGRVPGESRSAQHAGLPGEPQRQLTDREVDVLRLIGKGYKVPEAASLLGISAHTVTSYVRDIYRKLDISSRAEAAVEAARRGLVS